MLSTDSVVVIDNGSGLCKVGFAGQHLPSSVFPSIVGRVRMQSTLLQSGQSVYIGEEALIKKGILGLKYPIEHGIITNWEDMELIWQSVFANELRVPSDEHPVLLTEAPLNPKSNKEKTCELMFENFGVPSLYIGIQAVLSLYASAMTTGLVVDIGDGVAHIVPTFEGYTLPHAIERINIAGRDITGYLSSLLRETGQTFSSSSELEICREIKEEMCYVALDFEKELAKNEHELGKNYVLPDGNSIFMAQNRFQACEILFKPELVGLDIKGVHESVCNSVGKSDIDVRRHLLENILLSGGSTLFEGFSERLAAEVKQQLKTTLKVKVAAPKERKFSVWIGGSVLGCLDTFSELMLSREEYYEEGASAAHRKFF